MSCKKIRGCSQVKRAKIYYIFPAERKANNRNKQNDKKNCLDDKDKTNDLLHVDSGYQA